MCLDWQTVSMDQSSNMLEKQLDAVERRLEYLTYYLMFCSLYLCIPENIASQTQPCILFSIVTTQ